MSDERPHPADGGNSESGSGAPSSIISLCDRLVGSAWRKSPEEKSTAAGSPLAGWFASGWFGWGGVHAGDVCKIDEVGPGPGPAGSRGSQDSLPFVSRLEPELATGSQERRQHNFAYGQSDAASSGVGSSGQESVESGLLPVRKTSTEMSTQRLLEIQHPWTPATSSSEFPAPLPPGNLNRITSIHTGSSESDLDSAAFMSCCSSLASFNPTLIENSRFETVDQRWDAGGVSRQGFKGPLPKRISMSSLGGGSSREEGELVSKESLGSGLEEELLESFRRMDGRKGWGLDARALSRNSMGSDWSPSDLRSPTPATVSTTEFGSGAASLRSPFGMVRMLSSDSQNASVSDLMSSSEEDEADRVTPSMSYMDWITKTMGDSPNPRKNKEKNSPSGVHFPIDEIEVPPGISRTRRTLSDGDKIEKNIDLGRVDEFRLSRTTSMKESHRRESLSLDLGLQSVREPAEFKGASSVESMPLLDRVVGMTLQGLGMVRTETEIVTPGRPQLVRGSVPSSSSGIYRDSDGLESLEEYKSVEDLNEILKGGVKSREGDASPSPKSAVSDLGWELKQESDAISAAMLRFLADDDSSSILERGSRDGRQGNDQSLVVTVDHAVLEISAKPPSPRQMGESEEDANMETAINREGQGHRKQPSLAFITEKRLTPFVTSQRSLANDHGVPASKGASSRVQRTASENVFDRIKTAENEWHERANQLGGRARSAPVGELEALIDEEIKGFEWRGIARTFSSFSEPARRRVHRSTKYRVLSWLQKRVSKEGGSIERQLEDCHSDTCSCKSTENGVTACGLRLFRGAPPQHARLPSESISLSDGIVDRCVSPVVSEFTFKDAENLNMELRHMREFMNVDMGAWTSKMIGFSSPAKYYAHMTRELRPEGVDTASFISHKLGVGHSLVQEMRELLEQDTLPQRSRQLSAADSEWSAHENHNEWGSTVLSALLECGINAMFFSRSPASFDSISDYYNYLGDMLRSEGVQIDCVAPVLEKRLGVEHPMMSALCSRASGNFGITEAGELGSPTSPNSYKSDSRQPVMVASSLLIEGSPLQTPRDVLAESQKHSRKSFKKFKFKGFGRKKKTPWPTDKNLSVGADGGPNKSLDDPPRNFRLVHASPPAEKRKRKSLNSKALSLMRGLGQRILRKREGRSRNVTGHMAGIKDASPFVAGRNGRRKAIDGNDRSNLTVVRPMNFSSMDDSEFHSATRQVPVPVRASADANESVIMRLQEAVRENADDPPWRGPSVSRGPSPDEPMRTTLELRESYDA
ncbi:hypothetical protein BSKO_11568 [Bryopsis sp. KO-2023]|nr:hypothetical protein BSKO_11568 [Bryopsis sp. KO-2023]